MSDSDCSNCNNFECEYRPEDHYNCYRKVIDALKKVITKEDLAYLVNLKEKIDKMEEEDYVSTEIPMQLEVIIFDFNEVFRNSDVK